MTDIIKSIIIGIVQGLTEFLPVSSSGHIEIFKVLLELELEENENLLFTLFLHLATALSTVVVFKKEVFEIIQGLIQRKQDAWNFAIKIGISMIPAGLVGFFLKEELEQLFSGNLLLVGCALLFTAILLVLADKAKTTEKDVNFFDALIIGISQAVAILPGVSRSGSTISTSVLLGNDRHKAAFFSFLMVIPLIVGATLKDLLDSSHAFAFDTTELPALLLGFAAAFIAGLFACRWMIALVKKAKLYYFSIYCTLVGIICIIYSLGIA